MNKKTWSTKTQKSIKDLYDILLGLASCVCVNHSEVSLYIFILQQTLRYTKLFEEISFRAFKQGRPAHLIFGLSCTQRTLFRSIKNLTSRGIILRKKNHGKVMYGLNIIKLFDLVEHIQELRNSHLNDLINTLKDSFNFFGFKKLPEIVCKKENKMKLEEAIKKGLALSVKANERKRQKLMQSTREYTPTSLIQLMRFYCADEDNLRHFSHEPITPKLKGQMRNWLKECKKNGVNVRDQIWSICRGWALFETTGVLVDDSGKGINLGYAVNFATYYPNRKYVDKWLIGNKEKMDQIFRNEKK